MVNSYEKVTRALTLLSIVGPYTHYSNCYALLLIPAGALLYLAIKRLSDINALNRGINITVGDSTVRAEVVRVDKGLFLSVLVRVRKMNDSILAVSGMAVRLGELVKAMAVETGKDLQESNVHKSIGRIAHTCGDVCMTVFGDFICSSSAPYREVVARSLYEEVLNDGAFRAKEKTNVVGFLRAVGVICYSDLSLQLLQRYSQAGHTKINVLNKTERCELTRSETLYNKGNALLLFLELSHAIEVSEC